jgi:hypothetical protein
LYGVGRYLRPCVLSTGFSWFVCSFCFCNSSELALLLYIHSQAVLGITVPSLNRLLFLLAHAHKQRLLPVASSPVRLLDQYSSSVRRYRVHATHPRLAFPRAAPSSNADKRLRLRRHQRHSLLAHNSATLRSTWPAIYSQSTHCAVLSLSSSNIKPSAHGSSTQLRLHSLRCCCRAAVAGRPLTTSLDRLTNSAAFLPNRHY